MVFVDGMEVFQFRVREAVLNAEIELANKILSRPYALWVKLCTEKDGARRSVSPPNLAVSECN